MSQSPQEKHLAMIKNLPAKTGKDIKAWTSLLKKKGPKDAKGAMAWLKEEHGLGHFTAMLVVTEGGLRKNPYADPANLVDAQFKGERARFRPIYDKVVAAATKLDADTKVKACKGYISLSLKRQFCVLKTSDEGLVLGLALTKAPRGKGLSPAKGVGGSDRITHMLVLPTQRAFDKSLLALALKQGG